jgi:hypoxanthine phosphoribosyltransferase
MEKDKFRCKLVSWQEIEQWAKNIVKKIDSSGYNPDFIIGLSRGGLVPARLISDILQLKDLYSVKTEHWGITASLDGKARLTQPLQVPIDGKKVLVVDDITDTGKSLKIAFDHINSLSPSVVKTATLLHITHSSFVPDYYSEIVSEKNWTWFIFPWNVYEDLRTLIPKTLADDALDIKNIKKTLLTNFHIDVRENLIEELLKDLEIRKIINENGKKWCLTK